jgi:hypothetical protein
VDDFSLEGASETTRLGGFDTSTLLPNASLIVSGTASAVRDVRHISVKNINVMVSLDILSNTSKLHN